MAWPLSQDYNEAIQDPQSSLSDPELRGGEATTNALGMPMPRSGNFADVYEFNCPATKNKWALKCFTRHVDGLRERYSEISKTLQAVRLPFGVEFQYLEQGIRVRGEWFPMLKMRWVEGLLLNEFVRDNLDKPAHLGQLGLIWGRMAKKLREEGIAHADLQHGNVLLVPGSKNASLAVKLIDYDGMFVPALAKTKSGEVGHPNYQHPQRLREGIYNADVDRFPLLVVATALRALSVGGRELWDRHDNGDNLLFRETDLQAPGRSALFQQLRELPDPQVRTLVAELEKSVERKLADVPAIDELIPEVKPTSTRVTAAAPPAKPTVVAPAASAAPPAIPAAPLDFADAEPAAPKRIHKQKTAKPPWALIAGGAAAAFFVIGVMVAGLVWALVSNSKPAPAAPPVAQNKAEKDVRKPGPGRAGDDKKPPPVDPVVNDPRPDEVKPIAPPIVPVKPAPAKNPLNAAFLLELPRTAKQACLSADGLRVAYTHPDQGVFRHREAPAFAAEQLFAIPGALNSPIPLASSPDGRKMAIAAQSADGFKVHLWDWTTQKPEATFSTKNLVTRAAFSPDMRFLMTYAPAGVNGNQGHWLYLHQIGTGTQPGNWNPNGAVNCFGFTPDSKDVFFAVENEQQARTWNTRTGANGTMPLPQATDTVMTKYCFSRDFSKLAYVNNPVQLQITAFKGLQSIAKVDSHNPNFHFVTSAFSPDNRFVLAGMEDTAARPNRVGRAMLIDLKERRVAANVAPFSGLPEKIELGQNGIGLLQGQDMPPRLYRLPTGADDVFAKNNPPTGDFVPLFNGKDLTGWKVADKQQGTWRVENGVLISPGEGIRYLDTERADFQDFHLRVEARVSNSAGKGTGGTVLVRSSPVHHGYTAVLLDSPNRVGRLRIQSQKRSTSVGGATALIPPGEWFVLEILAEGNHFIVKVNSRTTANYREPETSFTAGRISLMQAPLTTLEFRKIDIKELRPAEVVAVKPKTAPAEPKVVPAPPAAPVKAVRSDVPDAEKVAEAEKAIHDQFKKEYAKKANADLFALGEKLLQLAKDTTDDTTSRYVLLREARGLAVQTGRTELALKAASELTALYELDSTAMTLETIVALSKSSFNLAGARNLVDAALAHAAAMMSEDLFDESMKVTAAAETVARRVKNDALLSQVVKQAKQAKEIAKEFGDMKKSQEKLAKDPSDAAANWIVGAYVAFRKGDWNKGLPLLAKSGHAEMEVLAKKDLAADATDKAHVELGDEWWTAADKKMSPHQKIAMQWRAAHWYRQALSNLTGLTQNRVADRVKQVDDRPAPFRVAAVVAEIDRYKGHVGAVTHLALSQDGKRVFSGGMDGTLREWRLDTGKGRVVVGPQFSKTPLKYFALSSDERTLAMLSPLGKMSMLDLVTFSPPKFARNERDAAPGFCWLDNGRLLYGLGASWHSWELVKGSTTTSNLFRGMSADEVSVRLLVIAPDRNFGAALSGQGTASTFTLLQGNSILPLGTHKIDATTAAFSKDGKLIVFGSKDGALRVQTRPLRTNAPSDDVASCKGHSRAVRCVAFSPNGKEIVSGGDDRTVRIWDAATGKELRRYPHPDNVTSLVVTPDGRYIISACADAIIRVWRLQEWVVAPPIPKSPPPPVAKTPADEGFVPLFNGKDLTGWKLPDHNLKGDWRVMDSILTGAGPTTGYLLTTRKDFKDFDLRLEVRFTGYDGGRGEGNLIARHKKMRGYEIALRPTLAGNFHITSFKGLTKWAKISQLPKFSEASWIVMEVSTKGNRIKVRVNGIQATEFIDADNEYSDFLSGEIALRYDAQSKIEVRKIEIKEQPAK